MPPRVPVPDSLPEPVEVRLLPYWAAVKQHRSGCADLKPEYLWLYIESCPSVLNGQVISDMMGELPYHIIFKMQRNFNCAA